MKKLSFALVIFSLIALLYGCTPATPPLAPSPEAFTIDVKVDKPIYTIGENIYITVQSSQNCYLTLYDISTEGEVTQIFPNRFAADNLIQGVQVYRIPDETDQFDFEIEVSSITSSKVYLLSG